MWAWGARFSDNPFFMGMRGDGPTLDDLESGAYSGSLCFAGEARAESAQTLTNLAIALINESGLLLSPSRFSVATLLLASILCTGRNVINRELR